MGNYDGTLAELDSANRPVNGINSGYRTDGSDMKHFVYNNGEIVDTYTVPNTSIHTFYVTLSKLAQADYFDSSWVNGRHTVGEGEDEYLSDFLAFVAPCLTENVFDSYITTEGMVLEVAELNNSLVLRIYASAVDSGKTGENLILAEAVISGHCLIDFE